MLAEFCNRLIDQYLYREVENKKDTNSQLIEKGR